MSVTKAVEESLLQRTYVQKSRIFLLPLTGIKKDRVFRPINTYVSSPDLITDEFPEGITPEDHILIVNYPKSYREDGDKLTRALVKRPRYTEEIGNLWDHYETESIMSNPNFMSVHEVGDEMIYTFTLADWYKDWNNFIEGRYSLMSQSAKDKILAYRWNNLRQSERRKLFCYLHPNKEECIQEFSRQLEVSADILRGAKELCDRPNLKLETFKCEISLNKKKETEEEPADG